MTELDAGFLVAAWLTGLAGGSGHCLGMCGGILAALGLRQNAGWQGVPVLVAAHLGRLLGYTSAGMLAGAIGGTLADGLLGANRFVVLRVAAAALLLLIGLQLLLGRKFLWPLERGGARVWQVVAPRLRAWLPPRNAARALLVGALWGWLPCGLVYAQLTVAATSGSAGQGGALMLAFGLGTSVSLSALSLLLQALGLAHVPRQASGALLVLFAFWTVLPFLSVGHGPGH